VTGPPALDYPRLVHDALRDVVRSALGQVAEEGLPGEHHFVLAFKTGDPGVRVPAFLRDLHPEEMTVLLQHQFWDLEVDREAFSVTLTFGGARHRITVPFAALTAFADPSVPIGLQFEPPARAAEAAGASRPPPERSTADTGPAAEGAGAGQGAAGRGAGGAARVVRLDRFRKTD
jgi:hypothetical protein